jgi:hypothetical protein
MSVDKTLPSGIRSPDKSGGTEPNDLSYFSLSKFDTRNLYVDKESYEDSEIHKKPHDPDGILEGQSVLGCIFCDEYETAIEFDMELHLHERHRLELLTQYPLKGRGYTMDIRIRYFINRIKLREKFKQLDTIQTESSQP